MDVTVGSQSQRSRPIGSHAGQGEVQTGGNARPRAAAQTKARLDPLYITNWNPPYSRGSEAVAFIETYCRIVKDSIGGRVGDLIRLRAWQKHLIRALLATTKDDLLIYHEGLVGLPRKNGKSSVLSGLALWGLYTGVEGGEVYSVAGDKDQARITFGAGRRMVLLDPELAAKSRVYRDAIEFPETGSVWRVVSADAPLKEGLNPTFVLFDEVHVQPDDKLWNVFSQALGSRLEPLMVGITTAGVRSDNMGNDSLGYSMYKHGVEVATGKTKDPTFFFAWWGAKPTDDYRKPEIWKSANPGYGDIVSADSLGDAYRRRPANEFKTKRLNLWVNEMTAWLPDGAWDAIADRSQKVPDGSEIVLGFDGSWSNDCTAVVGCTLTVPRHLFVIGFWEKPLGEIDWHVDPDAVEKCIRDACKRYKVKSIAFDPYRWQDFYTRLEAEGLPVVEFPTNSIPRMVPAVSEFDSAVREGWNDWEGRKLTHDGNPDLAKHIDNARLKNDQRGSRIVKESKGSLRKIDLAVASVVAHDAASRLPPKRPSVYERRGLIVIGGSNASEGEAADSQSEGP